MKKFIIPIILFFTLNSFGDEIYFKDGKSISATDIQIQTDKITYRLKDSYIRFEVSKEAVKEIIYSDGAVYSPDEIKGLLFPFPVMINYTRSGGFTEVTVYDNNSRAVAEGKAIIRQDKFSISYERPETRFFITPELGYFKRTVTVRDFSKKFEEDNDSIISGIITDPLTGEIISKENVYSLKYRAGFYSFFLDLKAGFQVVSHEGCVNFMFNPYVSVNLVEYRKTVFSFKTSGKTETFSEPFDFAYRSSYGFGLGIGFYFPYTRVGFNINYDRRYFTKFNLPSGVRFKESYYDSDFQTTRAREVTVKYSRIEAHIFSLVIFFIL